MKGLLAKDFLLTLKVQGKTLIAFILFALVITITSDNPFFVVSYLTFICSMFSASSITYDEYGNGFSFLFTLPVDVSTYVKSKYIFSTSITIVAFLVSFLVMSIGCVIQGQTDYIMDYGIPAIGVLLIVLFYQALLIPIQLKFGTEKSRMVILGVTGGMCIVIFGMFKILKNQEALYKLMVNLISNISILQMILVTCIVPIIYMMISFYLSKRIMEGKEF